MPPVLRATKLAGRVALGSVAAFLLLAACGGRTDPMGEDAAYVTVGDLPRVHGGGAPSGTGAGGAHGGSTSTAGSGGSVTGGSGGSAGSHLSNCDAITPDTFTCLQPGSTCTKDSQCKDKAPVCQNGLAVNFGPGVCSMGECKYTVSAKACKGGCKVNGIGAQCTSGGGTAGAPGTGGAGGPSAGGAVGVGGGTSTMVDCPTVCAKEENAGCPGFNVGQCINRCFMATNDPKCSSLAESYYTCVENAQLECTMGMGGVHAVGCEQLRAELQQCTGGGGPGGGTGGGTCDPVAQTGCTMPQKCSVTASQGGQSIDPACQPSLGDNPVGADCKRQQIGIDDCTAGSVCTALGVPDFDPNSPTPHRVCRQFCAGDGGCVDGGRCAQFTTQPPPFGVCLPTCAPFSDCTSGQTCGGLSQDVDGMSLFLSCRNVGAGAPGDGCQVDQDCATNEVCAGGGGGGQCIALCDPLHACAGGFKCIDAITNGPCDAGGICICQ